MIKKQHTKLSLISASILAATGTSFAQEAAPNEDVEVIHVHGIRASMVKSVELKREANHVVDVITAEDVGKFPDNDVLESMQRISGVQISRDASGSASGFQIRGISQNRIELNGRSVAGGEGEGRGVNLSDIPSELIAGLEVIKSPTADMVEGSLGATVNLKTSRPLQLERSLNRINLKAKYGDNIDEYYGNYNAVLSRKWELAELGQLGALINITRNDNQIAGDVHRLGGWGEHCSAYELSSDGCSGQVKLATVLYSSQ